MSDQFKLEKGLSLSQRIFYIVLVLIPFVYLIFFGFKYVIDLPMADEWYDVLPFVEKYYEGTLSLNDIWEGKGGHRTFLPRIIFIILARLTRCNFSYILAALILISTGTFVAVSWQIKRTANAINNQGINWIIPIASLVVFSLNQYGNWAGGLGLSYILALFTSVVGLVLLSNPVFKWWRFRSALLLGFIATTSSSNAVSYWFSGLFVLFFVSPDNMRIRKLSIILWVIAGFITVYLYTYGLPGVAPLQVVFKYPLQQYIKYTFKYLGAAVVPFYMGVRGAMFFVGLLGLILLGYISWVSIRFRRIKFQTLVPYISMCLYSIGSAALTAVGRIPACPHKLQPACSSYMTNSSLLWISSAVFLYLLVSTNASVLKPHIKNRFKKYAWSFTLILLIFLMGRSSIWGTLHRVKTYYYLLPAQNELRILKDNVLLRRLARDENYIKEKAAVLKKYRLSIFRDSPR